MYSCSAQLTLSGIEDDAPLFSDICFHVIDAGGMERCEIGFVFLFSEGGRRICFVVSTSGEGLGCFFKR